MLMTPCLSPDGRLFFYTGQKFIRFSMLHKIKTYFDDFLELVYPTLCIACHTGEIEVADAFCLDCYAQMPFTGQAYMKENDFISHFKGKIDIDHGSALFYFSGNNLVRRMIREMKYKGMSHYGILLGRILGGVLQKSPYYNDLDVIIPVPIHKKKEKSRGYNQSLMIAKGINDVLKIQIDDTSLIRTRNTATQTKMSREERIKNLDNAFRLMDAEALRGKNILLVDDVLTTGTTLLECSKTLLQSPGISLKFVTLAMGSML